jgi:hypothetical protein
MYNKEPSIDIEKGIKSGSYVLYINVPESNGEKVTFSQTVKFDNTKFTGGIFNIVDSSAKGSVVALIDEIEPLGIKQFLLPFFVNYGGSGTFLYLGLFSIEKNRVEHLDSMFIGDRVELLNISVVDNIEIILEYNGYKKGRAMSTIPDEHKTLNLSIKDKRIIKKALN